MASEARMLGTGLREYSYLSGNRLEKVQHGSDLAEYAWDNNGNMVSKDETLGGGPAVMTGYTFDAANRLRAVQLPSGTSLAYSYDPDGKRVKQSIDGEVTWFIFDGLSVVMELGADRKPTAVLVPGVCKVRMDLHEPLTEYYLYDGLGSVVQLTDERGNLTQEYRYDPFGGQINNLKDPFNRYRFVGLAHEDLTGLTYMNARWYDPGVGRAMSLDPIGGSVFAPQTLNRYAYCLNNPLAYHDVGGANPAVAVPIGIAVGEALIDAAATAGVLLMGADLIKKFRAKSDKAKEANANDEEVSQNEKDKATSEGEAEGTTAGGDKAGQAKQERPDVVAPGGGRSGAKQNTQQLPPDSYVRGQRTKKGGKRIVETDSEGHPIRDITKERSKDLATGKKDPPSPEDLERLKRMHGEE